MGVLVGLYAVLPVSLSKSMTYFSCDVNSLSWRATSIPRKYFNLPRVLILNSLA